MATTYVRDADRGLSDRQLRRRVDATRSAAVEVKAWLGGWSVAGRAEAVAFAASVRSVGPDVAVKGFRPGAFGLRGIVIGPGHALLAGAPPGFNGFRLAPCLGDTGEGGFANLIDRASSAGLVTSEPIRLSERIWHTPNTPPGNDCSTGMAAAASVDAGRVAVVLAGEAPGDAVGRLASAGRGIGPNVNVMLLDNSGRVTAASQPGLLPNMGPQGGQGSYATESAVAAWTQVGTSWRLLTEQPATDFARTSSNTSGAIRLFVVAACFVLLLLVVVLFDLQRRRALRRAETERSAFLAIVGHELRTPLTVMKGFIETLSGRWDHFGDDQRHDLVQRLLPQARRLNRVVERLLLAADIQAATHSRPEVTAVDVEPVLVSVVESFEPLAPLHHFDVDVDGGLVALADSKVLELVTEQLVDNAVKYSPSGGLVRVRARRVRRTIELAVEDDGVGLPADMRRIFDAFAQGEAVEGRVHTEGGVGVGLFIVRTFVDEMGGTVRAERRPGGGARLVVTLPSAGRRPARPGPLARTGRVNSPN